MKKLWRFWHELMFLRYFGLQKEATSRGDENLAKMYSQVCDYHCYMMKS